MAGSTEREEGSIVAKKDADSRNIKKKNRKEKDKKKEKIKKYIFFCLRKLQYAAATTVSLRSIEEKKKKRSWIIWE